MPLQGKKRNANKNNTYCFKTCQCFIAGDDDAVQFATNGEVNDIFSTTGRYSGSIDTTSGNNLFTFAITITGNSSYTHFSDKPPC